MKLLIGGHGQGKLDYAKNIFPEGIVFCGKLSENIINEDSQKQVIWNNFHAGIKEWLNDGEDIEKIKPKILSFAEKHKELVIISDEIGNGIIPMEPEERYYRETTGRLLIELSKIAESVERITCGIPQKLK